RRRRRAEVSSMKHLPIYRGQKLSAIPAKVTGMKHSNPSLTLYAAPMSSATPVRMALLELDVPHEVVLFDLSKGDQKAPAFLALNPWGKVPTLVIDDTPMFEASAILQWLGDH